MLDIEGSGSNEKEELKEITERFVMLSSREASAIVRKKIIEKIETDYENTSKPFKKIIQAIDTERGKNLRLMGIVKVDSLIDITNIEKQYLSLKGYGVDYITNDGEPHFIVEL